MTTVSLPDKAEKRAVNRTQWAAQFAVASELCKRGFEVSFTMGNNTPLADLMVVSPERKEMFLVDVKGLYKKNPFVVKRKAVRANLYYVFAFVPNDGGKPILCSESGPNEHLHPIRASSTEKTGQLPHDWHSMEASSPA